MKLEMLIKYIKNGILALFVSCGYYYKDGINGKINKLPSKKVKY